MRTLVLALLLVLTGWSTVARAEEAASPEDDPTRDYGGRVLLADMSAIGAGVLVGRLGGPAAGFAVAVGGLVSFAPAVHFLMNDPVHGYWSTGLRLALPAAGALVALESLGSGCRCAGPAPAFAVLVGAVLGLFPAMFIDYFFLSTAPTPAALHALLPAMAIDERGWRLGVGGRF